MVRSVGAVVLLVGQALSAPISAQTPHGVGQTPDQLIAAFRGDFQRPTPSQGAWDVAYVLSHPEDYPPADLERFLAGLQHIAMEGDSSDLRTSATVSLSLPGSKRRLHPVKGTFARLRQIYLKSHDQHVRSVAVGSMADLAEQKETAAFLEGLARKGPGDPDFPRAVGWALQSLPALGDEGRAAMKRLHESGAVRDPEGRALLAEIAKHDYRIR